MAEKIPIQNQELAVQETESGYNPDSGMSYSEYLNQGGQAGQDLREKAEGERSEKEGAEDQQSDSVNESTGGMEVVPVDKGELSDIYENNPKEFDTDDWDGMGAGAIASMANEPWRLGSAGDSKLPGGIGSNDPGGPGEVVDPIDNSSSTGEPDPIISVRSGEDPISGPIEQPGGPGTSSDPIEIPPQPRDTLNDGYRRIGEAVAERSEELETNNNMNSSEASNQAQAEFWGEDPLGKDIEPPIDGPEKPGTDIEVWKSPELLRAEETLAAARDEYARMLAGKEGSTFFSFRFSKNKVKAARDAYETAQAEAGALAVESLRSREHTSEEIYAAIALGSLAENNQLIYSQYKHEMKRVEKQSPRMKKFYEWWSRQGTGPFGRDPETGKFRFDKSQIKGSIKKGGVMAVLGAGTGLALGIAGAPILGGAGAAGAAGLAVARGINKGILGNRINRGAREVGGNLAEAKLFERLSENQRIADALIAQNLLIGSAFLNRISPDPEWQASDFNQDNKTHDRSMEARRANNKDARRAILYSAIGGAGGALLGNIISGGDIPRPSSGVPDDWDPRWGRQAGMASTTDQFPNAPSDVQSFYSYLEQNIDPNAPESAEMLALDNAFESIKDRFVDRDQAFRFNEVEGLLSREPGFGNQWTTNNTEAILSLVQEGRSAQDILNIIKLTNGNL